MSAAPARGSGIQPLVRCVRDGCSHVVLAHNRPNGFLSRACAFRGCLCPGPVDQVAVEAIAPVEPPGGYRACANPACLRKLAGGARYCCGGCGAAHAGRYDPDGYHSDGCDSRATERGEWTPTEAEVRR